jgi:hypothetical protein
MKKPSTSSSIIIPPKIEILIASPLVPVINTTTTNVFPVVARTLDRYCVSDRVGAASVSATLQDIGLITLNDKTQVVDRSKIHRARAKNRKNLQESLISFDQEFLGLYNDGRKDKTMFYKNNCRKIMNEEQIKLLKKPVSEYFGHISVKSSDVKSIFNYIISFLSFKSIDLKYILAIGCDGTAVNTKIKRGIVWLLEE